MKFIAMLLTSLFSVFSYCQDNFNDHSFDCQGVKIEMIYVEPGTFVMSKEDGENAKGEVPHKRRLLKPYYIGKYEVTNEQWCAIMDVSYAPSMHSKKARFPVENITWFRAMAFCERMNRYAPQGWHFTLPTEVQWEFAARGGNKSKGYKYSGDNDLNLVGWFHDNSS